jgi:hypothetical protein
MDIKQRPNHNQYIQALRQMTPQQRLNKAMELSAMTKELFLHGLRNRFPEKNEAEIMKIYIERTMKPEKKFFYKFIILTGRFNLNKRNSMHHTIKVIKIVRREIIFLSLMKDNK